MRPIFCCSIPAAASGCARPPWGADPPRWKASSKQLECVLQRLHDTPQKGNEDGDPKNDGAEVHREFLMSRAPERRNGIARSRDAWRDCKGILPRAART